MISMVIPTRDRSHTLRLVVPSFFQQEAVNEIIFVNDASTDDTLETIRRISEAFPQVRTLIITNSMRLGASQSRNVGIAATVNDYVLFCDDDEYMEAGYAKACLEKLNSLNAAAISGRRIYLLEGETPPEALRRFGNGMRRVPFFNPVICEYVNGAIVEKDQKVPYTNSIILTRKALLQRFPFDPFYARGNGYREDTDYQMNLYVNGYDIFITNDCHTFHLPPSKIRTGGQRVNPFRRVYWSIHYTRYLYEKYYDRYAQRIGLRLPRQMAIALFCIFCVYREFLRPKLHGIALSAMLRWRKLRSSRSGD